MSILGFIFGEGFVGYKRDWIGADGKCKYCGDDSRTMHPEQNVYRHMTGACRETESTP